MTIEEFRQIKNALLAILNKWDEYYENKTKNNNTAFTQEDELFQQNILTEYLMLQDKLLNSDLSLIPFGEWNDITLLSENELDFSKTHANIDFSLIKDISYETINLKGCNIKGLESLDYNEDTFDEEFKLNNPKYFPDKNLPNEIQTKFYKKELEFQDLIDYPSLRNCINKYSFNKALTSPSLELIKKIGYENAIKLFDEYPMFVTKITEKDMYISHIIRNMELKNKNDYEEAKDFTFKCVIEYLKNKNDNYLRIMLPKEIEDKHPEAFLFPEEINDEYNVEIADQFNSGLLNFGTLRKHREVLKDKIIEIGTSEISGIREINNIFGSIWNFLDTVPENLDYEVAEYIRSFYLEEDIQKLHKLSHEEIIKNSILKNLNDARSNYTLDKLYEYSKHLPIEQVIEDEHLRNFITHCGFENLLEFNKNHNNILDYSKSTFPSIETTLLNALSEYYKNEDEQISIQSYETLYNYLQEIISRIKRTENYQTISEYYGKKLSKIFPKDFFDYELLYEILKDNPNKERIVSKLTTGMKEVLFQIKDNPDIIKGLLNKDLGHLIQRDDLINLYYGIGNNKFLEIGSKYGESIYYLVSELKQPDLLELIDKLKTNYDYEMVLNEYIYKIISSNRKFDIRILTDSFKKTYPELYLSSDAPEELQKKFYGDNTLIIGGFNMMDTFELHMHPEWIPYLMHIDLEKCLKEKKVNVYTTDNLQEHNLAQQMSLYKVLSMKFTQEETLKFLSLYGREIESMQPNAIGIDLSKTKEEIYNSLLHTIYEKICSRQCTYSDKLPDEFKEQYPDIFLDKNITDETLIQKFYTRNINEHDLQAHTEWIPILKDKNLEAIVNDSIIYYVRELENIGICNERNLEIINIYGQYLSRANVRFQNGQTYFELDSYGFDHIGNNVLEEIIQEKIIYSILNQGMTYGEDLKHLCGNKHPELFLNDNAPEELKIYFYNDGFNNPLSFQVLKEHKEWIPYLKDKNVLLSLQKQNIGVNALTQMFNYFGSDEAIKIGIKNPEAVMKMLEANKFELFKNWYEKVHFIPHHVVMLEFPLDESDKFLSSGKKWSQLMKLDKFNLNEESKSALLKASMCFGVFDGDSLGYNKILELFTDMPISLTGVEIELIRSKTTMPWPIELNIPDEEKYTEEEKEEITKKMCNKISEQRKNHIYKLYTQKSDGKYYYVGNNNQNEENLEEIKRIINELNINKTLTPDKAHKLFGGFVMEYNPDFRDFLLQNMETILTSDEYMPYMSAIQKQWGQIKAFNSNRKLTLDLAVSFVKSNTYENIEIGNEGLAQVSNQAGYSQEDFETLQKIYNYGKARVFSSIPRIEKNEGEYSYEILRLDDPLALAIGTLTDCCQELGNAAEMCVEHSMVSNHGRVFVIRDNEGNIVAQSWVWRNKNVLCFDNIEIPAKAFTRAAKKDIDNEMLAETIYKLYEQAAKDLIEKDEKNYKELLDSGKITKEQYEVLRLTKVTVGIGYNDIKNAILNNAQKDNQSAIPIEFTPVVELDHGLYTNDSRTQYVLAGEGNIQQDESKTLTIYQDEFRILDNDTITQIDSLILQKLEYITNENEYYLKTQVDSKENILFEIADNYNFDPETTRIIMNANFAIIYDTKENEVIIGDIFYNESELVNKDVILLQLNLALNKIKEDREFNVKELEQHQIDIFENAMNISEELDKRRGISHGK